mmetsp:Transcript_24517/g.46281  ORF Transcript_24517/g.46281 Transcript_24517/m.46281 type:complete len:165 (-) Transcript_24517:41-535(-)
MSDDLLVGIFSSDVPENLRKPALSGVQPSFHEYGNGCVLGKGFDNDRAIQAYEAALQDMMENGGFANPAVSQICMGLSALYDSKAALTKDAKFYDRCLEYLTMLQQAMQAAMGEAVAQDPTYMMIEARRQKVLRKKERRLAKGSPEPELQALLNQRPQLRPARK